MAHIQQDFDGSSIQKWELDHGVVRKVINGCEYVICPNFARFQAKCEADKRERLGQRIAEAQAAAYLPNGGRA